MTRIVAAGLTDVGRVRGENQDCFGEFELKGSSGPRGRLAIIADGVGGHRGGNVASRMAVDAVAEAFGRDPSDPRERAWSSEERLLAAFHEANQRIFETAEHDPSIQGMASTCTALVVAAGRALVAHLGDSRAYLLRNGTFRQLTRDHSVVQSRVDAGLLTAEEARNHIDRNIITRSLGFEPQVEPELLQPSLDVQAGDRFVLSTDGLHGVLADEEIARAAERRSPPDACRELVDEANERGGPDNITVLILQVDEP